MPNVKKKVSNKTVKACRICLSMDRKMYHMKKYNLAACYKDITGIDVGDKKDSLPLKLCWECAHRLVSCTQFKNKALRSHKLMTELLKSKYLTSKNIAFVDRYSNSLTTNLSIKIIDTESDIILRRPIELARIDLPEVKDEMDIKKESDGYSSCDEILVKSVDVLSENIDVVISSDGILSNVHILSKNDDYSAINEIESKNVDVVPRSTHDNTSSDKVISNNVNASKNIDDYNCSDELSSKNVVYSSSDEILSKTVDKVKIDRRRKPARVTLNQDIFDITDLSFDEQLYEITKRTETANYKNSEYKCNECYKGFLDVDAFRGHMARHSDVSGVYQCKICKIRFKKQHALRNHTTSHIQKFCCKLCPYITTRRHAAKLHEEYHNGTQYQCPQCQENFVKVSTYMSHLRIKHPSDFVCELCGNSFVSAKGLGLHKKLKHRFEDHTVPKDGPSCVECGVNFTSKEALDNHLKVSSKHNDFITKPRKRIREANENKRDLGKTKKRGNVKHEEPIPCEQCDLQLPDPLSYYRHFRRSHPDKNRTNYPSMKSKSMCEVCGKMFQSVALLQDHSSTHSTSQQFRCVVCNKQFRRQYRLRAHRRVHLAHRRTHKCRLCEKRFTTSSNMQRHMSSHTGLKPFKCEICGKGFMHASVKRVHITYVHMKKPWPKRNKRKNNEKQVEPPSLPQNPQLDLIQPWAACSDTKVTMVQDKPVYYKI